MPGKHYLNMAREVVPGTPPASGWVGVAVEDLGDHSPTVRTMQPDLMVYGQQGPLASGRRTRITGGTGKVNTYLASAGMLLLLEAVFGAPVATELVPGEAWQYEFATSDAASALTFATQVAREMGAGIDHDTFVKGQVGQMTIMQGPPGTGSGVGDEGLSKISFDCDYSNMLRTEPQHLPTYVDPELYYSGGDFTLRIGETLASLDEECLTSWQLDTPTGMNFEDPCISTQNRDVATRGVLPAPKLAMAWTYKHRDYYNAWLNGELLALQSEWTGPDEIAVGHKPSVTIDIAAFGLTGSTAKESKTESTKQDLPSDVLWNGTDPMIAMTVVSSEPPAGGTS